VIYKEKTAQDIICLFPGPKAKRLSWRASFFCRQLEFFESFQNYPWIDWIKAGPPKNKTPQAPRIQKVRGNKGTKCVFSVTLLLITLCQVFVNFIFFLTIEVVNNFLLQWVLFILVLYASLTLRAVVLNLFSVVTPKIF